MSHNHKSSSIFQFVASHHMEERFQSKCAELGDMSYQIVFHGTDERSNVDSILRSGFDKNRVKRVRRGFSPAWTSSSFDKVTSTWFDERRPLLTSSGFLLCSEARSSVDEQVVAGSVLAGLLQS